MGRIREGDRVLVHSAGGGVGLMCLDLIKPGRRRSPSARRRSANTTSCCARGYDQLIDYGRRTSRLCSAGPGIDLALDPVGGESWAKSFRALKSGGRLICYGMSSNSAGTTRNVFHTIANLAKTPWMTFNPVTVINANKGVLGVNMGRMWQETERLRGWLEQLLALWEEGVIRPRVHAAVPFSRAAEAHQLIHDRANLGKIVLIPD
jgi:NADPH:quinone reductase-like Zn-dependent oxidoreductase